MNRIFLIKLTLIFLIIIFTTLGKKKNTTNVEEIELLCYKYLESNLIEGEKGGIKYHFYRPSSTKYSKSQWLWDSGSHMITWSNKNVTNSKLDLETMISMQQPNGFIPEIIFWGDQGFKGKFVNEIYFGNNQYTPITQTPVITFSLQRIYEESKDKEWLSKMIQPLYKYLEWWVTTRDPTNTGLVNIIHGWESGMDASPAYDEAYFNENPQPKHSDLYTKFVELLVAYHIKFEWNITKIINRSEGSNHMLDDYFFVQDTMVNCIIAAGYRILSNLANIIGDTVLSQKCKMRQIRMETSIINEMWMPQLNRFASAKYRDVKGNYHHARAETAQSLFPLLLETLPKEKKIAIIDGQLLNTSKFWANFPVPSVSLSDPAFQPSFGAIGQLLWRGPTWPIINYFIIEGLIFQNETIIANRLLNRWTYLYEISDVYEHYNPLDGVPYGEKGLGMSTLIVDSFYKLGVLKKSSRKKD